MPNTRIPLGRMVITAAANSLVRKGAVIAGLQRHASGDWGDLDANDRRANDRGLASGERILSSYETPGGTRFWIIVRRDK